MPINTTQTPELDLDAVLDAAADQVGLPGGEATSDENKEGNNERSNAPKASGNDETDDAGDGEEGTETQGRGEASPDDAGEGDDTEGDGSGDDAEEGSAGDDAAAEAVSESDLSDEELAQLDEIGVTASQALRFARMAPDARKEALNILSEKAAQFRTVSFRKDGTKTDDGEASPPKDRDEVIKLLRVPIPEDRLSSIASKMNIDKDALAELVGVVQDATLGPAADTVLASTQFAQRAQKMAEAQSVVLAVNSTRESLQAKYPVIRKPEFWKKLVASPATARLISAYREEGDDLFVATQKALSERIRATSSESMTARKGNTDTSNDGQGSRNKALKGTPTNSGRTRNLPKPKLSPKKAREMPLHEVLDRTFDDFEASRKQKKGEE